MHTEAAASSSSSASSNINATNGRNQSTDRVSDIIIVRPHSSIEMNANVKIHHISEYTTNSIPFSQAPFLPLLNFTGPK